MDTLLLAAQALEKDEPSAWMCSRSRPNRERKLNSKYSDACIAEDVRARSSYGSPEHQTSAQSRQSSLPSADPDTQRVDFDHGLHWLGHRVVVYWAEDSAHYPATIDDYDNQCRYHIMYDDEHEEWIDLPNDDVTCMPLGWSERYSSGGWESLVQKRSKARPPPRNRNRKRARTCQTSTSSTAARSTSSQNRHDESGARMKTHHRGGNDDKNVIFAGSSESGGAGVESTGREDVEGTGSRY